MIITPLVRDWRSILNEAKSKICTADRVVCGILLGLRVEEARGLGTLGVTRDGRLLVDPDFVQRVTLSGRRVESLVRILIHEALHVLFLHPKRCDNLPNHVICNIAADAIVESVIDSVTRDKNLEMLGIWKRGVRYAPAPGSDYEKNLEALKSLLKSCGIDWSLVRFYTLEEIYARLEKCLAGRRPCSNIDYHPWGAKPGVGGGEDRLSEYARMAAAMMRERGGASGITGRLPGDAPGELERMLEIIGVKVRVDWRQILQKLLEKLLPSDYTWLKPSRRSHSLGVYLPGVLKRGWKIAIVIDTSGSISDEEYIEFVNALWQLLSEKPVETVIVAQADVKIQKLDVFIEPPPPVVASKLRIRRGYGGTNFETPIRELLEKHPDLDLIIYFTDGFGRYPSTPPPVPIVWVISREAAREGAPKPPFGHVVYMT